MIRAVDRKDNNTDRHQTTILSILLNKPVLMPNYLRNEAKLEQRGPRSLRFQKRLGQIVIGLCFVLPMLLGGNRREGTYLKLILVWASPVLFLLWTFAYQLLLGLPRSKTWLPIWMPTLYLWVVDTLALQRGTWSIVSGTKIGWCVWPHLDVEEAVFFLLTNTLVVWGSCAFDNAVAILDVFPEKFSGRPRMPSPLLMIKSLLLPTSQYNERRLEGLRNALVVLAKKSRSFYLASGVFSGCLRVDLILLYAACRLADDLIDDAPNAEEAQKWIANFSNFFDIAYSTTDEENLSVALQPFPPTAQSILRLLPTNKLPSKPLYSLLDGFRIDLQFSDGSSKQRPPIKTKDDLERYATCVAATIGELCLSLVYAHDPNKGIVDTRTKQKCLAAGARMGRVLQYVNIVRDVSTDAEVGRCYLPADWSTQPSPTNSPIEALRLRKKLLDNAFQGYRENRDAIEELPSYARDGIRVAVESYMEIGRVLRERLQKGQPLDFGGGGKQGRASVPRRRRLWVGWMGMAGRRGST